MTLSEIKQRYEENYYEVKRPSIRKYDYGHVFDENESVKWNRDRLIKHNETVDREMKEYFDSCYAKEKELEKDVCNYISSEYEVSYKQAELIQAYVWEEYHSCMSNYFYYIDEIAEFVKNVIECSK